MTTTIEPGLQGQAQPDPEKLLVGACELGLLESAWEYFVNQPRFQYHFVIDAPAVASVYALPPHNIAHFGIAGLLDAPERPGDLKHFSAEKKQEHYKEQAQKYPLALGLTEILARYIFERRWSSDEPKLMMSSQISAIATIMEAVGNESSRELSRTYAHAGETNPLNGLRNRFQSAKNSTASEFINDVIKDLEKYLPAIYGEYSETRRLFRYSQAVPFPDRAEDEQATVFARSYELIDGLLEIPESEVSDDIRDYLGRRGLDQPIFSLSQLTELWLAAIPKSGRSMTAQKAEAKPDDGKRPSSVKGAQREAGDSEGIDDDDKEDGTEQGNARTLAEIEYLNLRLQQIKSPVRLVFVTTTGRLFRAALYHGGKKRLGEPTPSIRLGSKDSYNKIEYLAQLLGDGQSDLGVVPLLDPRVLMTSPDFVNFANRERKVPVEDASREISAWLPAFFSEYPGNSGELDVKRLFQSYQHYQGVRRKDTKIPDIQADHFSSKQYDQLRVSWNAYIRIISAAEGVARIVQRDAFHAIRSQLLGDVSLQELIGKRLDDAMSSWLAIVGGNALQKTLRSDARRRKRKATGLNTFRVVPPLILPAFSSEKISLFVLVQHLRQKGPVFREGEFSWLTKPKLADFEIAESDPRGKHKARYIQMLGQAVLFASLNNWDAAYRLATQAYALAEQFLRDDENKDLSTYVSGREAAYFASVASRRLRTSWAKVERPVEEGHIWVEKYRKTIAVHETYIQGFEYRLAVHRARCDLEQLAWDVFAVLYRMYRNGEIGSRSHVVPQSTLTNFRDSVCDALIRIPELDPASYASQLDGATARMAYTATHTYLLRQVASIGLHVELLLAGEMDQVKAETTLQLVKLMNQTIGIPDGSESQVAFPLSDLERLLMLAGNRKLPTPLTGLPELDWSDETQEGVGFGLWRCQRLRKCFET